MGARILAVRLACGMTQAQLGDAISMSYPQIQKFEGGVDRASCETIEAIAVALGVPVASFFKDTPAVEVDSERGEVLKLAAVLMRLTPRLRATLMKLADALMAEDRGKT